MVLARVRACVWREGGVYSTWSSTLLNFCSRCFEPGLVWTAGSMLLTMALNAKCSPTRTQTELVASRRTSSNMVLTQCHVRSVINQSSLLSPHLHSHGSEAAFCGPPFPARTRRGAALMIGLQQLRVSLRSTQ